MTAECEFLPTHMPMIFGTALAVEWLLEGGRRLTAALWARRLCAVEEVLARCMFYGIHAASMRLEKLPGVAEAYRQLTKTAIPNTKRYLVRRFSKWSRAYTWTVLRKTGTATSRFAPESVGAARRIVIGKHSGKQSLKLKLEELGLHGICDWINCCISCASKAFILAEA
jgi:homocitrate synthase NifV